MRNSDNWKPTKFVIRKNKLMASRNVEEVSVASRLIADRVAAFYDEFVKTNVKGRVLDLGCGKTPLYLAYKDYADSITCVDWANSPHDNPYIDYICDLNCSLPFVDGSFDTIILSDVLEHIADPQDLWMEVSRVLDKGGKVIVNVPFYYCIHEAPFDYYRYTRFALIRFVERSGLNLVTLRALGGSVDVFCDFLAKHLQFTPLIGSFLASVIQFLASAVYRTSIGKSLADKTAEAFPYGYFLIAEK